MGSIALKGGMIGYAFTPTASDTVDIKADVGNTRALDAVAMYVVAAGNVSFITPNGVTVNLTGVPINTIVGGELALLATRIRTTGTTAVLLAVQPNF